MCEYPDEAEILGRGSLTWYRSRVKDAPRLFGADFSEDPALDCNMKGKKKQLKLDIRFKKKIRSQYYIEEKYTYIRSGPVGHIE